MCLNPHCKFIFCSFNNKGERTILHYDKEFRLVYRDGDIPVNGARAFQQHIIKHTSKRVPEPVLTVYELV